MELSSKLDGEFPESIVVGVTQATIDVCDNPNPGTVYEAKFSLQHCVSIAILYGQIGFDSFDSEARQQASGLAKKFSLKCNEEFEKDYPDAWGAEVKVKLTNGKELSVLRKNAKGDPEARLSPKEMLEKAEMLFRYGGVPNAEVWYERILGLSREKSFCDSDLIHLLDVSSTIS